MAAGVLSIGLVLLAFFYLSISPQDRTVRERAWKEIVEPQYPPEPIIVSSSTPFWACFRTAEHSQPRIAFFDSRDEALVEFDTTECREQVNPQIQEIRQNGIQIDYLSAKISVMTERESLAKSRAVEIASQFREELRKEILDWSQIAAGFGTLLGALLGFGFGVWFSQQKGQTSTAEKHAPSAEKN